IPDGHIFTQPWPAGSTDNRRDQVIYYQYQAERARRSLRGIDQQVAKAEKAVAGQAAAKRNRFVHLSGGEKPLNRELETKARNLAGIKGYVTNLDAGAEFVIGAYHRLFQIEKSFRMSKSDLQRDRFTITPRTPSTRTSRSCSPRWQSAAGSNTPPDGPSD